MLDVRCLLPILQPPDAHRFIDRPKEAQLLEVSVQALRPVPTENKRARPRYQSERVELINLIVGLNILTATPSRSHSVS
jgi:hypothetical protein